MLSDFHIPDAELVLSMWPLLVSWHFFTPQLTLGQALRRCSFRSIACWRNLEGS